MLHKRFWALLLSSLALPLAALGQTPQTDVSIVEETYAKLAFAVQTTAVSKAVMQNPKIDPQSLAEVSNANIMHYTFQNVTSGNLKDIADRAYDDFVTKPEAGEGLQAGQNDTNITIEGAPPEIQRGAEAQWEAPATVIRGPLTWGSLTLQQAAAQVPGYDRYVALTVAVSYRNRSHSYKSMWFFDSHGKNPVLPVDLITGNSVLAAFVTADVTPQLLLQKPMIARPAVRQWLQANQILQDSCNHGTCCLPSGKCGIAASTL